MTRSYSVAARFGVLVSFVVKLLAVLHTTDSLKAKPEGSWRYSKLDAHGDFLMHRVAGDVRMTLRAWQNSF